MQRHRWLTPAWFVGLVLFSAALQAKAAEAPVQVEALGVHQDPQTGARYVAAQFTLAKGWHLYWQYPGDSGQAPGLDFSPHDAAGPPLWPRPTRLETPPLASYGYSEMLVLPAPLLRDDHDLTAEVHWLACAQTCVPGRTQLHWSSATLQTVGQRAPIAHALEQVPQAWPAAWALVAHRHADDITLVVTADPVAEVRAATFFAHAAGGVDENKPKYWGVQANHLTLRFAAGRSWKTAPALDGTVVITDDAQHTRAYTVHTPISDTPAAPWTPSGTIEAQNEAHLAQGPLGEQTSWVDIAQAMALACLGGMLLNLMPCVFPVLSMKVLSYINTSGAGQARRRRQAWWYALGNIVTLTGIGSALLGLRAMGQSVGWGFQMQSPVFVMTMAMLMFVMGLSQLGLLSFGERLMGIGQNRAQGHSDSAAFLTGVLTVIVATPCSAPFMGVATAAALTAPTAVGVGIFAAIGLGVALPYLVLCYVESVARCLPRPGLWMLRLREASGLCLWGSGIWLLWIVGQQCGPSAMAIGLMGLLLVGSAARLRQMAPDNKVVTAAAYALAALGLAVGIAPCYAYAAPRVDGMQAARTPSQDNAWQPYSAETLASLRAAQKAVFVDFTAAWCVSCQVNEALVLNTAAGDALFARHHVTRLKADWTDQNADITQALTQLGRSSVPLYVLYPSGPAQAPILLPAVLTPGILQHALDRSY